MVNHSNVELTASFTWKESKNGIYAEFDKASLKLASADQGESLNHYEKAPSGVNTFRLKDNSYISDFEDGETGTIGTITVKLGSMDIPVSVSTEEELADALADGGSVRLTNDISMTQLWSESYPLYVTSDFILDLNGHTLSYVGEEDETLLALAGTVENGVIKNGTMKTTYWQVVDSQAENLTIDQCTLISENVSDYGALYLCVNRHSSEDDLSANIIIKNSTVEGGFYVSDTGCYLDITDNVEMKKNENKDTLHVVDGASLKCSVNPTDYGTFTDYYEVTDNGDGTWTVAPKIEED